MFESTTGGIEGDRRGHYQLSYTVEKPTGKCNLFIRQKLVFYSSIRLSLRGSNIQSDPAWGHWGKTWNKLFVVWQNQIAQYGIRLPFSLWSTYFLIVLDNLQTSELACSVVSVVRARNRHECLKQTFWNYWPISELPSAIILYGSKHKGHTFLPPPHRRIEWSCEAIYFNSVRLFVCPSICMSDRPSVFPPAICPSVQPPIWLLIR